ncbi:autotransporter domain-containing protein [Termitidicoccus mucosus]|uniref:autotransporter domain-containing protein n=1 Tax=Termitidicoccus mucosus TaxID=1184151 RepID=UPI003184128C
MKTAPMSAAPVARASRRAGFLKNAAALFAALACLALAPRAGAQSGTITLTGGDPNAQTSWNTGTRWSDGLTPHADADYLVDSLTGFVMRSPQATPEISTFGGRSLTLRNNPAVAYTDWASNASRNAGPLAIKSGAGSILTINDLRLESYGSQAMIKHDFASAGAFTLAGNITLVTGTSRILLLAGSPQVTFVIKSNISGSGGLWLDNFDGASATNLFVLAGNNTYTGVTWLTGGTSFATNVALRLDSDAALGNTSGVKLDSSGASIDLNGHSVNLGALSGTFAASRITNRAAGTTGTATITVVSGTTLYAGILNNAPGALAVTKAGSGTLVLNGTSNTWSGDTRIDGGLLLVHGNAGSNPASAVTIANGAALGGTGTVGGIVTLQNGGVLRGAAGSTLTIGGLAFAGATGALDVTLGAPSATPLFQVNGNVALGGLVHIADATLAPGSYALAGYTGALTPGAGLAIGSVSAGIDKLILSVDTATAGKINLYYGDADYWTGGAGTWDAAAQNWTDYTATGSHAWRAGVLAQFRGPAATVTVGDTVSSAGLVFATDGWQLAGGTIALASPTSIIRVGDATAAAATFSTTIASAITGAGGIEKTDLGTLVLAGDNTYTGATIVREGALVLNGSHSAAAALIVKTGARLSGTGATSAIATIENGGILAATAGPAPLTLGGLVLSASSHLNLALGAPSVDALLQVNGDLTLDGILNITDIGGFGAGLYRIINYTGGLTDNGVEFGSILGIPSALLSLNTATAGQVNLIYQAANLWNTGNGTWSATGTAPWLLGQGADTATGFALFAGAPATVTVDNAAGPITPLGMQFATDGWLVTGGTLTTAGGATLTIRVGDGTPASAAFSATIASAIAGSGGIEKNDYGTLVLAGNNTHAGATTIRLGTLLVDGTHAAPAGGGYLVFEGGALGGSGRIAGAVAVENGGVLLGASGATFTTGNLTLAEGAIVNVALGSPAQSAAGATTLFRVNGDLVLDGTLHITDAGGMGPGLYRIFEYTGVLDDRGLELGTLPAPAYGAESLLTLDTAAAGQVNLLYGTADFWTGGNGIWDATTANWTDSGSATTRPWGGSFAIFRGASGTVTINAGSGSDAVAFNGAQFASDGYTLAGNVIVATTDPSIIRVGDGTGAGAAMTATVTAEITGAGGLDKTDLGTLVLAGNNTYTGATRLKAGTTRLTDGGSISAATIFPGARLEGAGTVRGNLVNNGILAPAAVTPPALTIQGDYTQTASGTFAVTLGVPNSLGALLVNGNASLAGELLVQNTPGFAPGPGSWYTILRAASITGTFDTLNATGTLSGPFAGMSGNWGRASQMLLFEVLYGATDVRLSFTQLSYASADALPGLTANQRAVGAAVDTLLASGSAYSLTGALNSLQTEGEVLATLNALSPQVYERYFAQALHSVDAGVRSIEGRLASTDGPKNKWSLWTELVVRSASFAGDADIRSANSHSYGAQAGVDRTFGERVTLGLFLSITDDDLDDRLEATRHLAGVYGRAAFGNAFADIVAGGGVETLDATRIINIPGHPGMTGYPAMPRASMDANEYFASARLGYALALGKTRFTPYAALQYMCWEADAFNERTAWDTQLRVGDMEGKSFATRLGFDLAWSFGKKTVYTPRLSLAWRHEFEDSARDISASIGGSPFTVRAQKPETDGFIAALGFDAALTARLTAYLGLAYERSTALKSALDANAGLMWKF